MACRLVDELDIEWAGVVVATEQTRWDPQVCALSNSLWCAGACRTAGPLQLLRWRLSIHQMGPWAWPAQDLSGAHATGLCCTCHVCSKNQNTYMANSSGQARQGHLRV